MSWDIEGIDREIQEDLENIQDLPGLEKFRIKYLGRKGLVSQILSSLGGLSAEERPKIGRFANELKQRLSEIIDQKKLELTTPKSQEDAEGLDFSLPGIYQQLGHEHPISQVMKQICSIFSRL
jgi:phenylalanyl-tRNA synthetase alpha chain